MEARKFWAKIVENCHDTRKLVTMINHPFLEAVFEILNLSLSKTILKIYIVYYLFSKFVYHNNLIPQGHSKSSKYI